MRRVIESEKAPKPIGPYSQAILANGTLYISGQIALNAAGDMVQSDIAAETTQVMENIKAILAAAGLSVENIVKSSIFVKDLGNFGAINEVYGKYFTSEPPARETVEVSKLPKDANVEISVIAVSLEV